SYNGHLSGHSPHSRTLRATFVLECHGHHRDLHSFPTRRSSDLGKTAADLDGHLKNADFFEVEKYPTSKLEITSVRSFDPATDKSVLTDATNIISGNLTIKEKTVNVSFPAKVSISENEANVQSKYSIKRQEWGLN